MKVTLQIDLDYKSIRQMMAITTGEALTDEEIKELSGDSPFVLESSSEEFKEMRLALSAFFLAKALESKVIVPVKSKFAQRIEELKNKRANE